MLKFYLEFSLIEMTSAGFSATLGKEFYFMFRPLNLVVHQTTAQLISVDVTLFLGAKTSVVVVRLSG